MEKMQLVKCTKEYWNFVKILRFDSRVLSGFINSKPISEEEQNEYMKKFSDCYRIAIYDNRPVGYVGVIDNDIRVCTDPDYQGKGIGKFMINECMKIWPNAYAKIKIENEASFRLFESCGFIKKFVILTQTENN